MDHQFISNPACYDTCDVPHCETCGRTINTHVPAASAWHDLPERPYVVGHRGDGRSGHENTPGAFERARRLGASWVELDVVATADDQLVIHHDQFTSDGRPIWECRANTLPYPLFGPHVIPDGCGVQIEVKTVPGNRTSDLLGRLLTTSWPRTIPTVVICFDPYVTGHFADQNIPAGFVAKQGMPIIESTLIAASARADMLIVHGPTSAFTGPGWDQAAALRGPMELGVWDAEPAKYQAMVDAGVSAMCTDQISELAALTVE